MTATLTARRHTLLGYLAALGAAFCYGSAALLGREIVSNYAPPMVATAFPLTFGTIIVAALFHQHVSVDMAQAPRRAWLMVALAGVASSWGVSFWFLSMNEAPVVLVAPVVGITPLVSITLTHIFLSRLKRVTWRTVWGALLVSMVYDYVSS